jgi:hypothetical protein
MVLKFGPPFLIPLRGGKIPNGYEVSPFVLSIFSPLGEMSQSDRGGIFFKQPMFCIKYFLPPGRAERKEIARGAILEKSQFVEVGAKRQRGFYL